MGKSKLDKNKNPYHHQEHKYLQSLDIRRLLDTPISYKFGLVTHDNENSVVPIEYMQNSYGFRTPEFNNQGLMALGCSYTYGIGLPEEYRWPDLLSKEIGMECVNLGLSGDSVMGQVRNAFWYFKNFGHPKVIVGIFPMYRMELPLILGKTESRHGEGSTHPIEQYSSIRLYMNDGEYSEYSKQPHRYEKVLPREVSIYMSNVFIEMLDQYCKANDIKFFWTYWEQGGGEGDLVRQCSEMLYDSYISLNALKFVLDGDNKESAYFLGNLGCHSELSEHPLFHRAADRQGPEELSHWGIHRHIHIANQLSKMLKVD